MFRHFFQALKEAKEKKKAAKTLALLEESELSIEMIRKICLEYHFHFEIHRPDGTVLKFFKTDPEGRIIPTGEVW